jgi:hypothetical protein
MRRIAIPPPPRDNADARIIGRKTGAHLLIAR